MCYDMRYVSGTFPYILFKLIVRSNSLLDTLRVSIRTNLVQTPAFAFGICDNTIVLFQPIAESFRCYRMFALLLILSSGYSEYFNKVALFRTSILNQKFMHGELARVLVRAQLRWQYFSEQLQR